MKIQSLFIAILFGISTGGFAESTAPVGAAATGLCKDGTAWTGDSKRGACRGHKGVKEWYADKAAATPAAVTPSAVAAPVATPAPAPMPANSVSGTATGLCKDGTQYSGSSKRGACRGHKGLQQWYADDKPAASAAPVAAAPVAATTPVSTAPSAGTTGLCKDGTAWTGDSKRGACRGHKGVKEWYADKQLAAPAPTAPISSTAPAATTPSAGATGLCKDGTAWTGDSKRGACRGHKGVKEWYADTQPAVPATTPAATQAAPPQTSAVAAPTAAPAVQAPAPASQASAPVAGSGKVWVNTNSKIYHCEGTKFYGKTKAGEYMDESQAQAKGFVANRKKTCGLTR